jgi:hypothetical protein
MQPSQRPTKSKAWPARRLDKTLLDHASIEVKQVYSQLGGDGRVAKGSEMGDRLIKQLEQQLAAAQRTNIQAE